PSLYTLSLHDALPIFVNGLYLGFSFSYYEELLQGFKRIDLDVHLKCFTAVEIHFFAQHYKMTHAEVLERLRAAGLGSLPGGGAEDRKSTRLNSSHVEI